MREVGFVRNFKPYWSSNSNFANKKSASEKNLTTKRRSHPESLKKKKNISSKQIFKSAKNKRGQQER